MWIVLVSFHCSSYCFPHQGKNLAPTMHSSRCLSIPSSCSEWFHSCSLYSLGNNFTACTTVILFPSLCINLTGSTQTGLGTSPRFHFYYLVVLCICKAARFSYQNIHFFIIFPGPPAPDNLFFSFIACVGVSSCALRLWILTSICFYQL